MGKPKLRPLPAILKLVESLSEDERADLRDYLRPAPKPRQKGAATTRQALCVDCSLPAAAPIHHESREGSHLFRKPERKTAQKRKAGKEATPITAECGKCPNPFGTNIHHLTTEPDYHEFSEKTEFTASASG